MDERFVIRAAVERMFLLNQAVKLRRTAVAGQAERAGQLLRDGISPCVEEVLADSCAQPLHYLPRKRNRRLHFPLIGMSGQVSRKPLIHAKVAILAVPAEGNVPVQRIVIVVLRKLSALHALPGRLDGRG